MTTEESPTEVDVQRVLLRKALARVRYLEAENQVWRELVVEMREASVLYAQAIWHSQLTERVRKCMANPETLRAEVEKKLAEESPG